MDPLTLEGSVGTCLFSGNPVDFQQSLSELVWDQHQVQFLIALMTFSGEIQKTRVKDGVSDLLSRN